MRFMAVLVGLGTTLLTSLCWSVEETTITASEPEAFSYFGDSVAVSDDAAVVLIGAPRGNTAGENVGAAYLFVRNARSLTELILTPDDGSTLDKFGEAVSISSDGRVVAIGSPLHDHAGINAGSVYVYIDSQSGQWASIPDAIRLNASDSDDADAFGSAVSLSADGRVIAVGAPLATAVGGHSGSAYVFRDTSPEGDWSTPPDEFKIAPSSIRSGDRCGSSVSISGTGHLLLVGCSRADGTLSEEGSAYLVFDWDTSIPQSRRLQPSFPYSGGRFGYSVALSSDGTTAMVGSYRAHIQTGDVDFYSDPSGSWTTSPVPVRVTASDGQLADSFGFSVSIDKAGDTAAVGAPRCADNGENSGAAYVLRDTSATGDWASWSEDKIVATEGTRDDLFGGAVFLSDEDVHLCVGAAYVDTAGYGTGSAYLFSGPPVPVELIAVSVD